MIELNLIPTTYRQQISRFQLLSMTKDLFVWLMIYLIFLAAALLAARFVMQQELARIIQETNLVTFVNRSAEAKVSELNARIDAASQLQAKRVDWPTFLSTFGTIVPRGVTLQGASFLRGERSRIDGIAATRDDLLSFKQSLENTEGISEVELPVTTLLSRENIPFTMTFTFSLGAKP